MGAEEGTCNFKIKALEMNDTPLPTDPANASGFSDRALGESFHTTTGWKWRVQSPANVVGINSIDDLTKTKAWFTFKTANITGGGALFDGGGEGGNSWSKHSPQPPYFYCVDTSTLDRDVDSSTEMFTETDGEYYHTLFESFGHSVTSKALAYGNEDMPDVFDNECRGYSLPYLSDLECELFWELLGYQ